MFSSGGNILLQLSIIISVKKEIEFIIVIILADDWKHITNAQIRASNPKVINSQFQSC